ncbi:MAG: Cna B-type domain-containing protein [Lachnospiraceae bacterium]|nr:Cna B-type domain-containing protein [Lachnospiraceae bacterium]
MKKKILAMIAAAALFVGMLPSSVLADVEEPTGEEATVEAFMETTEAGEDSGEDSAVLDNADAAVEEAGEYVEPSGEEEPSYEDAEVEVEADAAEQETAEEDVGEEAEEDYGIMPLMDGTGSTFPVNTIYHLSVVWTTYSGDETVYSWTRDNHVTSENNSDQSTIDALPSGSYRVRISFEDLKSDQDLQAGQSYVLALDWPTGEGVTVTPGGTSGTITSGGTDIATWSLDPETGKITIEILALPGDDNACYIEFTATVEKANDDEPDGDNWEATGDVQKDGVIDELVDDKITYTITAVVPRYSLNGGKAYVWSIDDHMTDDSAYGGDYNNDMSDVEIVMTSTQYPNGIIIPSIENATEEDEYAYYVKVDSDKEDEIIFLNRCTCDEDNCADWSEGCGNLYDDTGFCSCWLSIYNATFTITYSVDISEIIQGMEDHANTSAATTIRNSAYLYNGGDSPVDNDSDTEYVYHPFTKSETTNPDKNTEDKGVGSYKIEIYERDVDYSWADDIEVTDVMDNLALVEDSLTVTVGDTVLTLIDEEEAAGLDKDENHDKYYSYTYTDITEDGEVTGGTLVIKVWYPTNQNITIEYQASVLSYNTSSTGDYSNSVTIDEIGYTLNGSYQEGSSGEGGSGLTCSMTLTKVDADDNDVVLPGAVFEIYRHVEDGEDLLLDTLTTGEDGTFTFASNDDKGYWMDRDVLYYVKEIEAPEGYVLVDNLYGFVFLRNGYEGTYPDGLDPQNVIMGEPDGDQIHIEIMRENTPTSVSIFKYATGEDESKNPLKGAEFVLSKTDSTDEGNESTVYASFTGENGSYVFSEWVDSEEDATTLTTGEDGYIYITYLPIGTYDLTEIKAPYGYVTLEDPIEVVVSENNDSENPAFVEVENKEPEPQITKEIAEDDYERKDQDIEHDDSNGHFEENVDGDGWGTWDDADNNQEVTYHLKLTDIKDAVNLTVHDYLEDGLDFEPETVGIELYDGDTEKALIEGADYSMTQGACSDPDCAMDGCTFEVKFADSVFTDISSDAYLMITYKALTDTQEEDYDDYMDEILNHSYMTYGVNVLRRSDIVTTATDLFGFGVYKYAGEDDEEIALAGAEFVLERNGVYATFATETDADTGETFYMISGWVQGINSAGTLISDSDGMIRIEGLDDDTYTITETKAPVGYEIVDEAITVVIDEDGNVTVSGDTGSKEAVIGHVVNIENTPTEDIIPETVDVDGSKTWDDSNNEDGLRPESITIRLYADGEEINSVIVTSEDDWKWEFTDLDKYNEEGAEIAYTITEDEVNSYTSEVNGYDVTNTYTPEKPTPETIDVSGSKTWNDDNDKYGKRPESITIHLTANGEEIETVTVTEANDWKWSFADLDKYDSDGKTIVYTITEDTVEGYETSVNGYDVTNTYKLIEEKPGSSNPKSSNPESGNPSSTTGGKTDDPNHIWLWLTLLIAACALATGGVTVRTRRVRRR